ncbi:hypothetical protein [Geomesophilobacter sediminis]|uniref:Uncharacterized protein n=1 Tax=Geomesophilobacter sediminis TaxID=2798584 RepID=A0A8J7SBQ1_9BACT|nr:hypothetical protein [Geomesophilobacter sediminis]MBJ6727911.1 hypothetical protein [Geomesophilobacter sediminis]
MKRIGWALLILLLAITVGGCGGSSGPSTVVTQILSDPTRDQDIALSSGGVFSFSGTDTATVLAGIDPSTLTEYRAFLDFSLGTVPADAVIVSATLDIFIDNITPQPLFTTIPIRIDLVSYPQPLVASDFDRNQQLPLASTTIVPPIAQSDLLHHVAVDVTPLMQEAQRRGLSRFQVRILEDLGPVTPGLIEIEELATSRAPLLTVEYF